MLYACKDGAVVAKAPAPNHEWAANKTAIGCLIIEDARDLELSQVKEQAGIIVARGADDLLAQAQVRACAHVDAMAEVERQRVLTPGAGQAMAYQQKEAEAKTLQTELQTNPSPDPAKYPFLSAEVGVTKNPQTGQPAADLAEVAGIVLALAEVWKPFGAAVENTRLAAKGAISEAPDMDAVQAIIDGVSWPAAPVGA